MLLTLLRETVSSIFLFDSYKYYTMTRRETIRETTFSLTDIHNEITHSMARVEQTHRPIIGISTNHNHIDENTLTDTYADSVRQAGGIPLIIPIGFDAEELLATLQKCDGIIMSGGGDVHPLWFGEQPHQKLGAVNIPKDYFDIALIQGALQLNIPILGICRGMQLLNVALGGTLVQDLPAQSEGCDGHVQTATRYEVWHKVEVLAEGRLRNIFEGLEEVLVNSFHHQAIKDLAPSAVVTARATDGTIEAVDFYPEHNAMGVQWHPEALGCEGKTPHHLIFKHLIHEATLYSEARKIHKHILTLDSHVDTPSLFVGDKDYNFMEYSSKALVDYPKMVAGLLDTAIMAAYVPQQEISEKGHEKAYQYALDMLDATDSIALQSNNKVAIVREKEQLKVNKIKGIKSILKAVENGYAIGDQIQRLSILKEKGIKYITLCHNGDNLICDSASKSEQTHGGLSSYGHQVIQEMNRLGIAVDISHASDKTIEDVLQVSTKPIIASHSSCRALCNHPRNLPDYLIQAISEKGGVIQLCMYSGFVREEPQKATVVDFVNHIEHAISIAGIEHVGIGTDFDGDGEVIGCRDTTALIRITIELLRKGYQKPQIQQIWGGNLLRVLE